MIFFVIGFSSLPHLPGDGQPAVGQTAVGLALAVAAGIDLLPIGRRPDRLLNGFNGELLSDAPEIVITGLAEANDTFLATALGVGTSASQGLWNGGVGELLSVIAFSN